jgi:hypothetical protein
MPSAIRTLIVVLWLTLGLAQVALAADYLVGRPLTYGELVLFPLYPAERAPALRYVSLEQASRARAIRVTELEGDIQNAKVNAVHVTNRGKLPVLMLAGEVIVGGKHDRLVAVSTVVPPGALRQEVPVFCVERGRWNGHSANLRVSGRLGHSALRARAALAQDQIQVWDEVSSFNAMLEVAPESEAYRVALEASDQIGSSKAAVEALLPALLADSRIVGLAVAIGGEVVAMDTFATPELFAQLRDQLLESYAMEAAARPGTQTKARVAARAVHRFLDQAEQAAGGLTLQSGAASSQLFDGETVHGVKTFAAREPNDSLHVYFRRK